jgi:hypothetical protein
MSDPPERWKSALKCFTEGKRLSIELQKFIGDQFLETNEYKIDRVEVDAIGRYIHAQFDDDTELDVIMKRRTQIGPIVDYVVTVLNAGRFENPLPRSGVEVPLSHPSDEDNSNPGAAKRARILGPKDSDPESDEFLQHVGDKLSWAHFCEDADQSESARINTLLAELSEDLDRTTISKEIKVPTNFAEAFPILNQVIETLVHNHGMKITKDPDCNISLEQAPYRKCFSVDKKERLEARKAQLKGTPAWNAIQEIDGLSNELFRPTPHLKRTGSTKGGKGFVRYLLITYSQEMLYSNSYKNLSKFLLYKDSTRENLANYFKMTLPSQVEVINIILNAISMLVRYQVSCLVKANEKNNEDESVINFLRIIDSYRISRRGIVQSSFNTATRRRLKSAAKEKARRNAKFKPRDNDWEDYTAMVKPSINTKGGIIASAPEIVTIKEANKSLQSCESIISKHLPENTFNITLLAKKSKKIIDTLHEKCRVIAQKLSSRKSIVYNTLDQDRREHNKNRPQDEQWDEQFTSADWSNRIAEFFNYSKPQYFFEDIVAIIHSSLRYSEEESKFDLL